MINRPQPLLILLAIPVFLFVASGSVYAQAPSVKRIKRLTIELMPEFDREGILVIYKGLLLPQTPLPAKLSFSLGSDIHLNAVAFKNSITNKLLMGKYEARTVGERTMLDITATSDNFWIEFYTTEAAIQKDGDIRKFSYSWNGSMAVDEIKWSVQQPVNGTGLNVEPAGGVVTRDDYGLPAYKYTMPQHPADTPATLNVTYRKPDNIFTSSMLKSPGSATQPQPFSPGKPVQRDGSQRQGGKFTPLMVIIVVTLVGLGLIFFRKKR